MASCRTNCIGYDMDDVGHLWVAYDGPVLGRSSKERMGIVDSIQRNRSSLGVHPPLLRLFLCLLPLPTKQHQINFHLLGKGLRYSLISHQNADKILTEKTNMCWRSISWNMYSSIVRSTLVLIDAH